MMSSPTTSAEPPRDVSPRRTPIWAPALAALLTGALVAEFLTRWQHPHSWSRLLAAASFTIGFTWMVSAISAWLGYALFRYQTKSAIPYPPWRVAVLSLWLVPLAVLIRTNSLWSILPATIFTASLARLIWRPPAPIPTAAPVLLQRAIIPKGPRRYPAFATSLALQAGTVAAIIQRPAQAAALLGATTALLAAQRQPSRKPLPPSAVLLVSTLLTIFGLLPYLPGGGTGFANANVLAKTQPRSNPGDHRTRPADAETVDVTHIGVILYPEVQKHVTLVPPLPAGPRALFSKERNPLSIPFFGAYWFFRPPDLKPPPRSLIVQGTPVERRLTSTGFVPLHMEARQNLGSLIDLGCCRKMEISIQNADRYPGTVGLDLILINTTLPGAPEFSLGVAPVTSTPPWHPSDDRPAISETLSYTIPESRPFRKFDEIRTVFRLSPIRKTRSAMVAIDRFVLVPR